MSDIAVVFGGPSPEHDISVSTGLQVTHTLARSVAIYWDKTGRFWQVDSGAEPADFAEGVPRKAKEIGFSAIPGIGFTSKRRPLDVDVVCNCCHGGPGEDGTLQGALDLAGYTYTGPGRAASALGMDKLAFGEVVRGAGLPTLPRVLLTPEASPGFEPPYIVKPRFGGSSIGIEVVEDLATARHLAVTSPHLTDGAVVEPHLSGFRDLQIAVRTHPSLELSAIEEPTVGPDGVYSYRQKYLAWGGAGTAARKLPAELEPSIEAELRRLARAVTSLVGLRSVARIDFLEQDGDLWVNEVNTIPGSLAAYLWVDPPVDRASLIDGMIDEARSSGPRWFGTAGADGSALRDAASIASKLG